MTKMKGMEKHLINVQQIARTTGIEESIVESALASCEIPADRISEAFGNKSITYFDCFMWAVKRWAEGKTTMFHPSKVIIDFLLQEQQNVVSPEWLESIAEKIPNASAKRSAECK